MPIPPHQRPVPPHVEIPELPAAMNQWIDFVAGLGRQETRWKRQDIIVEQVVDGLSAARALAGFRYTRSGDEWTDEAGDAPGMWRREWLVVALLEGDPIIADISQPKVPVLLAEHGMGDWRPKKVHRSLASFQRAIKSPSLSRPSSMSPHRPCPETPASPCWTGGRSGKPSSAHCWRKTQTCTNALAWSGWWRCP